MTKCGFQRWGVSAWTEVGLACSWVRVVLNLINVRLGRLVENGGEKPTPAVAENSKELCEPSPADPSKFAPIVGEDAVSTQKDEVAPATAVDAPIADITVSFNLLITLKRHRQGVDWYLRISHREVGSDIRKLRKTRKQVWLSIDELTRWFIRTMWFCQRV
nr:hypothetical protein CFP56_03397 [Quercus suber]